MLNAEQVQGQWNTLRGKVQEKWGQLTDDDLRIAGGNVDQLVGQIQRKTGEAKEAIEKSISDLMSNPTMSRMADAAAGYAHDAAAKGREVYDEVGDHVREGAQRLEKHVQEHPVQSMLAILGMGIITGVVISVMLRRD
ncbi:MAG TPA: CsbD family protein [Pirellulales bacterium]|nr:CsbD family protein [Pirellulales bacterium]